MHFAKEEEQKAGSDLFEKLQATNYVP